MKSFKLSLSLLGFILILFSISPVYGVDFSCPGGGWVEESITTFCSGSITQSLSCISGDTKTTTSFSYQSLYGCSSPGGCPGTDLQGCSLSSSSCPQTTPGGCTRSGSYAESFCQYVVQQTIHKWQCPGCTDSDGDGYYAISPTCSSGNDCDDGDVTVYPGATELCDGIDNNCDGETDEGCFLGNGGGGSGNGGGGSGGGGGNGGSCGNMPNAPIDSYVNVTSSNINHSQPLFRIKGGILYLDFELTYNSLDGDGPLGHGWTHTHNVSLKQNSSTEYILKRGYGKHIVLIQNGSEYKPPASAYPVLTINPDGTYKLRYKDSVIYNFDTTGKLTSIEDKYTNTINFTYTNNNLTGITDTQNPDRALILTYYPDNKIQTITDPNNNIHTFTYQNGYLTGITTQTPDTNDIDPVWSYTYKTYGYMWTKTDPTGNTVTYVYDENDPQHRLLQTIDPETKIRNVVFDPANTTTTITEKDGGVWIYKYSATTGLLTEKRIPEGYTPLGSSQPQDYVTTYTYETNKETVTDNRGNITEYIYDTNRNLMSVTEKSTTDTVGRTTTYTYYADNEIWTITDPEGHTTTYTYETISGERIVKIKDPALEETEYRYYADGRLKHIKNPKNQTTTFTFTYDPVTKRTTETITDFLGVSAKRIYDISGNIIETRDQFDIPTKYEYDSLMICPRFLERYKYEYFSLLKL